MKTLSSYRYNLKVNDEDVSAITVDNEPVRRVYDNNGEPVWGFPTPSFNIKMGWNLPVDFMYNDYYNDIKIRHTKDYTIFVLSGYTVAKPTTIIVFDHTTDSWKPNNYITLPAAFAGRFNMDVLTRSDSNIVTLFGGYESMYDSYGYAGGNDNPNPQYKEFVEEYNPYDISGDHALVTCMSPTYDWRTYLTVDLEHATYTTHTLSLHYAANSAFWTDYNAVKAIYDKFEPRVCWTNVFHDCFNGDNIMHCVMASGASVNTSGGDVVDLGFMSYTKSYKVGTETYYPMFRAWFTLIQQPDGTLYDETMGVNEGAISPMKSNYIWGWQYKRSEYNFDGTIGTTDVCKKDVGWDQVNGGPWDAVASSKDFFLFPKNAKQAICRCTPSIVPRVAATSYRYLQWYDFLIVRYVDEYDRSRFNVATALFPASPGDALSSTPTSHIQTYDEYGDYSSIIKYLFRRFDSYSDTLNPSTVLNFVNTTNEGGKGVVTYIRQHHKTGDFDHELNMPDFAYIARSTAEDYDTSLIAWYGQTTDRYKGFYYPYAYSRNIGEVSDREHALMGAMGQTQCVSVMADGMIRAKYENEDVELAFPYLKEDFVWEQEYGPIKRAGNDCIHSKYCYPIVAQSCIADDFNKYMAYYDKNLDFLIVGYMQPGLGTRL